MGRIARERAEDGSWELVSAAPAAGLRGVVRRYAGFTEHAGPDGLRRREPAQSQVALILNFGATLDIGRSGGPRATHADSFVARVSPWAATTEFRGESTGVQIDLSPVGAHMLLGLPMHELPEPAVSLSDLLGPEGRRFTERVEAARGWEARFAVIDRLVAERLARARSPAPSIEWALDALGRSRGTVPIGRIGDRLGCSPRHLITGFREAVGVTPKTAARIMRFEHALELMRARAPGALARVAADAGYTDQAHMTREFHSLAGAPPGAYAAAWQPGFLGVPEDRVNSVQAG